MSNNYIVSNWKGQTFDVASAHSVVLQAPSDVLSLSKFMIGSIRSATQGFFIGDPQDTIFTLRAYPILPSKMINPNSTDNNAYMAITVFGRHLNGGDALDEEPYIVRGYDTKRHLYYDMGNFVYYSNSYLDQSNYTKIICYLPFLGDVELNPDKIANKRVYFRLGIDTLTGEATYYIIAGDIIGDDVLPSFDYMDLCRDGEYSNLLLIGTYTCRLGIEIPLTRAGLNDCIRNGISSAIKLAMASSINWSSPYDKPEKNIESVSKAIVPASHYSKNYKPIDDIMYSKDGNKDFIDIEFNTDSDAVRSSISSLFSSVHNITPQSASSGNSLNGPNSIIINIFKPKIVEQSTLFNHLYGKPLGHTELLINMHGFTKISNIHISNIHLNKSSIPPTNDELLMLKKALLQGVYLP